jgi:hypothetical protein
MRSKIVAGILLIMTFPVFSFVLAAPIPVREVREACADAMEGDEDVIMMSEKRAPWGARYKREVGLSGDSWAPDYASGIHPGVGKPLPSSGGGDSPLWSKVWSTPGGTAVPWNQEGPVKPGTTAENQPASITGNKPKLVSWASTKNVLLPSGDVLKRPLQSDTNLHLSPPPGQPGYVAKQQPKSFGSKFKAFFSKLSKFKFRPRSPAYG